MEKTPRDFLTSLDVDTLEAQAKALGQIVYGRRALAPRREALGELLLTLADLRDAVLLMAPEKRRPRPKKGGPRIELSSCERIARIDDFLVRDFIKRVLDVKAALLTDESSLHDFAPKFGGTPAQREAQVKTMHQKIRQRYEVETGSTLIVDVLEDIARAT